MKRKITDDLLKWKDNKNRKPLLVLGVRQCGKTYSIKEFGEKYFENICYINFETDDAYSSVFKYDFNIERIIKEIEIMKNTKIEINKTLLFFDEIQECPRAITSLKYFCENLKELHVICAGSLLGVALKQENISFPVGKVNRLQMYPMSFEEFLNAAKENKYLELLKNWPVDREIPEAYSSPLKKLLKTYYTVGGMPEIVKTFFETKDFEIVSKMQDEMLQDYADDFSKHAPVSELEKIRLIWDSVPKQLAKENNKFVFSHVKEGKRAHELEGALGWLKNAGLIQILELVENPEIPLSANADATYFKVYLLDIGLLCRRLGLSYKEISDETYDTLKTFKGAIAENYVLNELISQNKKPYFWRSKNMAELDFIFENDGKIVPVEVKAADNTQAKSYKSFCKKYVIPLGYKASLKNIGASNNDGTKTISLPLYLLWNMDKYK